MTKNFEKNTFSKRLKTMLAVDFGRMFGSKFVYILIASCLVMPIAILVMTTMMDGTVSVDPQTGAETVIEGFDNVWQIIGSLSNAGMSMDMGITAMCNINLLYFILSVLVCIFVAGDFRSGFSKNLFTVRSKKTEYIISKTVVCSVGSALMILAFFAGSMLGGAIAGLPFDMDGFNAFNIAMCVLSKMILVAVFVPIYLLMSVISKHRSWLAICLSMMVGMFMFMMIPMLTPLNSTFANPLICIVGGVALSLGFGAISNAVIKKTSLV